MKKLLPILTFCLFCLNCEQGWLEDIIDPTVLGCNVNAACNYDPDVNENDGTCEFLSCKDCLGYPHGIAVLDSCGTCDASLLNDCIKDCDGTWGGTATTDNCENCSTSNIACELDCMGVWGGTSIEDECGVCNGNSTCRDCNGVINGTAYVDGCQNCVGGNTEQTACSTETDCAGVLGGSSYTDNCDICDSDSSNDCQQDCAGTWGGTSGLDACNICGGDGTICQDCAGTVNGSATEDNCGTCDSNSSNDCSQDCNGDWGGTAVVDNCGECGGNNTDCTDCSGEVGGSATVDCAGVCGGLAVEDCAGVCGGDNSDCEYPDNGDYSLDFDGANDYVNIGNPVPANLQIQQAITLEAWIYIESYPPMLGAIVSCQYEGTKSGYSIHVDSRTSESSVGDGTYGIGHIHFQIGNGSWNTTNAFTAVPLNEWVHVAATRGAYNDGKVYYNGLLQPSESIEWDGTISYSGAELDIGDQTPEARYFEGQIDGVKIWNYELSPQEIQDNILSNLTGDLEGLMAYYKFNAGFGTTLYDYSGNGNHGTINGASWVEKVEDCAGVVGGSATVDDCGVCGGSNDCFQNCSQHGTYAVCNAVSDCVWLFEGCYSREGTIELNLGGSELTGEIPTSISHLVNLTSLVLTGNQLSGTIPSEIWNMVKLTNLQLDHNQFTGEINPEIGNMQNLIRLELDVNELTGGIPSEIGNLVNLTELRLNSNQLSGVIPVEIGSLTKLTNLWLDSNELTGEIPTEIGYLTNLEKLFLDNNQLTEEIPTGIGNLTSLTSLKLSLNQLSGEIPAGIGNLTSLTSLSLNNNQLTGEIPSEIGNLTRLTGLYLSSNQLSGEIPAGIGNLTSLTSLPLHSNQLTGEIPTEIGNLTSLTHLYLASNQLTGEIPTEIGNLTSLTNLRLYSNQLTGEIPESICNLTSLTNLRLYSNQLCPPYPSCLTEEDIGTQDISACPVQDCAGTWGGTEPDTDGDGICDIWETVTDVGGNTYTTVLIGNQLWLQENLKVTKYKDSSEISNITNNGDWGSLTTGAYGDYDNNSTNSETYGRLYNWYAVDNDRGICPEGWHVPLVEEWTVLTDYLGGDSVAGGKMKETGTEHWDSPNEGATNESEFTALPAGTRSHSNGDFGDVGTHAFFWASWNVEIPVGHARYWILQCYNTGVDQHTDVKARGLSIRCLKD